ncbi:hypothetical protein JX265_001686 [Neoarthrinium moseri]|uniref:Uncharacterized protein n=1 Tax=Neoarthrinium moseri TaxID=1658444 RepID=A0A9P9WVV7_9PEZI|nr:uncharacterized protein JN550_005260 [Neoarthrinium moseri]KAI1842973.1 hypothetical protein JX266_010826 [Neoarthrinium moseri]KAI1870332.1 hypothetical protein JN550_005260 [Neoarthrinium moseri]KAI1880065.1 hypothetical protein JX265_001686 [Neoarthrinium moseri]
MHVSLVICPLAMIAMPSLVFAVPAAEPEPEAPALAKRPVHIESSVTGFKREAPTLVVQVPHTEKSATGFKREVATLAKRPVHIESSVTGFKREAPTAS